MTRWMMALDETGEYRDNKNYFVIAGILYKYDDFDEVKEYFVPIIEELCQIIGTEELHLSDIGAKKKNQIKLIIFSHLGSFKKIKPIVYIIDKENTWVLKKYDKKSNRYNKILEFLYLDLIDQNIIKFDDELAILIDKLTLSDDEENNMKWWLSKQYPNIIEIGLGDSCDFRFLQICDAIANSFSNDKKCDLSDLSLQVLHAYIGFFPKRYRNNYVLQTKDVSNLVKKESEYYFNK